jgi:alpha-beta hydrolase superfamily lysophospholipase
VEVFEIAAADGARLSAYRWDARGPLRGVVQIAHGAAEHLKRYDRLARALGAAGYAVVGADHRGHGVNAAVHGLGEFGPRGFAGVVDDMAAVTAGAQARFPGAPLVLLGHSLGSFAAQAYLLGHADALSGLVLSGTAALDALLASRDPTGGLKSFNAAFEPARTDFDWLSRDEAEVDAYVADPLCGFDIGPDSMASVAATAAAASSDPRLARAAARRLPVYVISGEADPVVGPGQAFARTLVDRYAGAGLTDLEHRVYAGGRHEMFNETNRDEVVADLIAWLDSRVGVTTAR